MTCVTPLCFAIAGVAQAFFSSLSLFPNGLPAIGIQHFNSRLPGMVTDDHNFPVVDHWRATFSQARTHFHPSKVTLPKFLSIVAVGKQSARPEPAIYSLIIAKGRSRSETGVSVMALVWNQGSCYVPPKLLSRAFYQCRAPSFGSRYWDT